MAGPRDAREGVWLAASGDRRLGVCGEDMELRSLGLGFLILRSVCVCVSVCDCITCGCTCAVCTVVQT